MLKNVCLIFLGTLITESIIAQSIPEVSPIFSGGYIPGILGVRD